MNSYRVFGFKVSPGSIPELTDFLAERILAKRKCVITSQNLHGVYSYFHEPKFRALHEDANTFVRIDGMPILWMARLAGVPTRGDQRVAWIDWFQPLLARAQEKGWRIFYLGGNQKTLDLGIAWIRREFPELSVGGRNGYFKAERDHLENTAVVSEINAFAPDLLIVGMGMGRQESWVLENRSQLECTCVATCGALLEYYAGTAVTPPRWTGKLGLEWAYRLCTNPRRFGWRYLVEPWITLWYLLRHNLSPGRNPPLENGNG